RLRQVEWRRAMSVVSILGWWTIVRGTESIHHRGSACGCGPDACLRQSLSDGADDQPTHQSGVAEADIGLGRVHIDVDQSRVDVDEKCRYGVAVARQHVGIRTANCAREHLVTYRPAIDVKVLVQRICAGK